MYPSRTNSTIGLAILLYTSTCLQFGPKTVSKVNFFGGSPWVALELLTVNVPRTSSTCEVTTISFTILYKTLMQQNFHEWNCFKKQGNFDKIIQLSVLVKYWLTTYMCDNHPMSENHPVSDDIIIWRENTLQDQLISILISQISKE